MREPSGSWLAPVHVLARVVLILHGVEDYTQSESAAILGISRGAVEGAYAAALQSLDVLSCEMLMDSDAAALPRA